MPTTNNILESHNRKVNRFIAYKEMPPVAAVHDAFKYCEMEVRELSAIRSGHTKVQRREGAKRAKLTVRESRRDEYPELGRAPQTCQELGENIARKSSTTPRVASTVLSPSPMNPAILAMRQKIQSDGLKPGTIVQCHNDLTTDKWYMKIIDGTVCALNPDDPCLKLAGWFESNSTSKIDARQQPEPCYIRAIIGIHSTPSK
jgi:hypothetical protein